MLTRVLFSVTVLMFVYLLSAYVSVMSNWLTITLTSVICERKTQWHILNVQINEQYAERSLTDSNLQFFFSSVAKLDNQLKTLICTLSLVCYFETPYILQIRCFLPWPRWALFICNATVLSSCSSIQH